MRILSCMLALFLVLSVEAYAVPDPSRPPCGPSGEDIEKEHFLLHAEMVTSTEIGKGITKPLKLELTLDGENRSAVFKSIDRRFMKLSDAETKDPAYVFTDMHSYERAAYLLDRILDLCMVPVAVTREIDGIEGAVIEWIPDAVTEKERRDKLLEPLDPEAFQAQRSIMKLFDALIRNTDRNLGNQLITTGDWKLHLIDHSRSFRLERKIPKWFKNAGITIPRPLYDRLRALDRKTLRDRLKGLLSAPRIRALLVRRDLIIKKIDRDRRKSGDDAVFGE